MANGLSQSRRLVSQEDAHLIERSQIPRSRFHGSWSVKTTFDAGWLIPFMVEEVYPADHMKYEITAYLRLNTPLFPMMDSQRVDTHIFFVPMRLVWDNFVKMMGEQDSPTDSINYVVPFIQSPVGGFAPYSIYDYFGLPTELAAGQQITVNALPGRCYRLIWHEWFRDQNLQSHQKPPRDDGPDPVGNNQLLRRAKSADYFTTALPWPQKFTAPAMPFSGNAPVSGLAVFGGITPTGGDPGALQTQGLTGITDVWPARYNSGSVQFLMKAQGTGMSALPAVYADLSGVTGLDINTFRQAFLVQALLERDARGGTRYTEQVARRFGVTSPDFRLQRPEYIGGGSSPLTLTPIAQTAPSTGVPVGALGAAGTSLGQHRASFAATEHGYIIGLISVKSELSYQQGVHRKWTRNTRFDFYDPALAHLGEQAIYRRELRAQGNAEDLEVFGYQERWHELRSNQSMVTGKFRSTTSGTLDAWHLAQRFTTKPVLNEAFIQDIPPMDRVLAAGSLATNQQYLADILIRRDATRPMPMYSTPSTLGRF